MISLPIAMVSTLSVNAAFDVAPFSYFNIVGQAPMALSFSVAGPKPSGTPKATLQNAQLPAQGRTGEFVINIATEEYADAMAMSATPLAYDESEFDFTGLTPQTSHLIKALRLEQARIAFECEIVQIVEDKSFSRQFLK